MGGNHRSELCPHCSSEPNSLPVGGGTCHSLCWFCTLELVLRGRLSLVTENQCEHEGRSGAWLSGHPFSRAAPLEEVSRGCLPKPSLPEPPGGLRKGLLSGAVWFPVKNFGECFNFRHAILSGATNLLWPGSRRLRSAPEDALLPGGGRSIGGGQAPLPQSGLSLRGRLGRSLAGTAAPHGVLTLTQRDRRVCCAVLVRNSPSLCPVCFP